MTARPSFRPSSVRVRDALFLLLALKVSLADTKRRLNRESILFAVDSVMAALNTNDENLEATI